MTKIKCKHCGETIEGDKKGTFIICKCRKCAIDETEYDCRLIGNIGDYELIEEENEELKAQLHEASLTIQEMTEQDMWCPENCDKLIKLQENYDRIYNENCKLREEHNINDISLLDDNYQLMLRIDKAIGYIQETTKRNDELGCTKLLSVNQVEKLLDILNGGQND